MNPRSTTFRFAALVFLCQLIAALVLLGGLGISLRTQSEVRAEATSEDMLEDLREIYGKGGSSALAQDIRLRQTRTITRETVMLLVDQGGKSVAGNLRSWPPEIVPDADYAEIELYRIGHIEPERMVLRATRLDRGERLLVGVVVEGERQLLATLEQLTAVSLVLALFIAAGVSWLSARVIVGRLDATIATLRAVRGGDIARRVPDDRSGDAFALLGSEVNHTLDRIDNLIGELKIATDSLAHDLKSPLTRLSVALERTVRVAQDPAVRDEAERALAEGERLHALVETALSISRAEAGIGRDAFATTDLSQMLETIAEIYEPLVEDNDRSIVLDVPPAAPWQAHRQLLQQAISNLIDNSIKYGGGAIVLSLRVDRDLATIAVRDHGPGIQSEQREQALRRFGRLDAARGGSGAGLGLALVQAVAHLHGGTVTLDDADPGLVVTIRLK